ncbi:matrixin family metalloprotease [Micromonospora sp. DT31]|uniref:matrixin family metalloprotease n=1 Tax=Micromonospora sp. DT31 TaxID=3393434 RepID=UPI003CF10685
MISTAAASVLLASIAMTGTAQAQAPTGTGTPSTGSTIIDPEQQYADFLASRRPDGSWLGAADPGSKAKAPTTSLSTYPKLTERQLATMRDRMGQAPATGAPTIDTSAHATVEVVRFTKDATIVQTYLPAPGVTPDQLATSLRSQGKQGVRVNRPSAFSTSDSESCAYGHARTISCPVSFFRNNGNENPIVVFNDHSGSVWPLTEAVPKWNQVPNIDSWYQWNGCPAVAGARCIDVFSGNYGAADWVGLAQRTYPSSTFSGAFADSGQWIQLNDYYAPTTFTRNNVVTHEVGHILGLGHNTYDYDVLYPSATTREDIGGENPVLLSDLYSVVR